VPLSDELVFKLSDSGTELNTSAAFPFVDILRCYGFDSAPIRETERDHEGVDGGFMDAEFEKGRPIMMDGEVYASAQALETYLDQLKKEWAPSPVPVPFYFRAPGQLDRVMFIKPRGLRYDWESNRRRGVVRVQFVGYAEDPRIYDAALVSTVITYGGVAGAGLSYTTFLDTFTTTRTDTWNTADSGHTYTLTGTASDFDTDGAGSGTIRLNAAVGTAYFATPNGITSTVNQRLWGRAVELSATPTGGTISQYFDVRLVDTSNFYRAELIYTTSNTVQVALIKVVAGTPTTLVAATTVAGLTSATINAIRVEIDQGQSVATGSILRAKVWNTSGAEPVASTVESAIDSSVTGAGGFRVGAVRNSGNTNVNPLAFFGQLEWDQGFGFNLNFGGGATPGGAGINNNGNRPTPAVLTILGPISNPLVANDSYSAVLNFNIDLGASDILVIDLANKTVLLNGVTNRRAALVAPNWFLLNPGVNFIRFGGTNGSGSTLTVAYRAAWR